MAARQLESRTTPVDCPDCARKAENQLLKIEGVSSANFDFINRRVQLSFDDTVIDPERLRSEIERQGHFRLVVEKSGGKRQLPVSRRLLVSTLISLPLAASAFLIYYLVSPGPIAAALFYLAILAAGWDTFLRAFNSARQLRVDMNVLMTLAVIGAVAIGEYHEAVAVVLLFSLANLLESYSLWRLSGNLTDLSAFTSGHALLKVDGKTEHVAPSDLEPGDTIVIREGMRIPVDGEVVSGTSYIDNSALTGESIPEAVKPGSKVFAGAINREGYLEVKVSATANDTEIGKILKMVGEASAGRSHIERVVDKFARIYTPAVVALAAMVAILPPLFFDQAFSTWFYKALVFLVISCPCALVISTPVAITTALAAASRLKAIFRKGEAIERLAAIRQIAFDKTGTLTLGSLRLEKIEPIDNLGADRIFQIAYSLEQASNHPYARAIRQYGFAEEVSTLPVSNLAAISGVGVRGDIDGRRYTLGGPQILNDKTRAKLNGTHGIYLLENDRPVGVMTFSEEIRPEAATTLQSLRKSGYRPIGMLSGDRQEQTDKIAQQLKLDYALGALTPQEKYEKLKDTPEPTLMIGDGINDAVALSGAFVSISVARFGADLASQQADITLFGDTISALPKLLRLARRTVATIKVNIVVAFAIKLLFLILAVAGYASIWMAVAADMGASLLVIAHSLRLLRK